MAKMQLFQGTTPEGVFKTQISIFDDTYEKFPIIEVVNGQLEIMLFEKNDMRLEEMGFNTTLGDDGYKCISETYVEPRFK